MVLHVDNWRIKQQLANLQISGRRADTPTVKVGGLE